MHVNLQNIGFDTAEEEPSKVTFPIFAFHSIPIVLKYEYTSKFHQNIPVLVSRPDTTGEPAGSKLSVRPDVERPKFGEPERDGTCSKRLRVPRAPPYGLQMRNPIKILDDSRPIRFLKTTITS